MPGLRRERNQKCSFETWNSRQKPVRMQDGNATRRSVKADVKLGQL